MARTREEVTELYAAAYAAKDAEAVGDLYEDDAIYSTPAYTGGWSCRNRREGERDVQRVQ